MADGNQEWTKSAKRNRRNQPDRRIAERQVEGRRQQIGGITDGSGNRDGTERRGAHRRALDRHQADERKETGRHKAIASWWSG